MVIIRDASSTDTPRTARSLICSSYASPLASALAKMVGFDVTPTHVEVPDQGLQVAGAQPLPADVVEPDRHAGLGEFPEYVSHGDRVPSVLSFVSAWSGLRAGAQPRAFAMDAFAAAATASAVMPNSL